MHSSRTVKVRIVRRAIEVRLLNIRASVARQDFGGLAMTQTLDPIGTAADFTITTHRCDQAAAELQLEGILDERGATLLRALIDGHLRDGRRFLRLDVRSVTSADRPAVRLLAELHRHLLDRRGTLILTGVTEPLKAVLRAADADLFMIAPTAADQLS